MMQHFAIFQTTGIVLLQRTVNEQSIKLTWIYISIKLNIIVLLLIISLCCFFLGAELLLNSASDDEDDENLMTMSIEKEANNNSTTTLNTNSLTLPSPRPVTPIINSLVPPLSDVKPQRPTTPSMTIDDKDGNDSEGTFIITSKKKWHISTLVLLITVLITNCSTINCKLYKQ